MFFFKRKVWIDTERLYLRAPVQTDYRQWSELRYASKEFLTPWEPTWSPDHLSRKAFRREDDKLVGAITLDNIRHGPAQTGTMGYWIGHPYARHGYMTEALRAMVHYAFSTMDLSRVESACLPENVASRGVLEKCGYKYEGVAQAYIQINGRWRTHVLYAALRADRRGRTTVGMA